jgi:hypothetical protein
MAIDPKIEEPARDMLGHAIRGELQELAAFIQAGGGKTLTGAIDLCAYVAGYIAIDVTGKEWPTDAALHAIAKHAAQSVTRLDISEEEIFEFLNRVALGTEMVDDIWEAEGIGRVPLYVTANLLLSFCPKGMHWWEYLDRIENAAEVGERVQDWVLPTLMLRVRKQASREAAE